MRRRRLVLLAAAVVVAAGVGGVVQALDGAEIPAGGTTTGQSSSVAPSSPAVRLVDLSLAAYTGRPVGDVQTELAARGLLATLRPLTTSDVSDGQVISLDPVGLLAPAPP